MQKQDYEKLIDKKIKDAKLELWESRFKYFVSFTEGELKNVTLRF